MKIQKLFLAVLSSSVLCTSCMDNFLDTESPSIPSDENLFKSTALTEAALMGVYATMTDTYIYGQKLCVNWQGASDVEVGSGAFSTENYNSTLRDEGAGQFYGADPGASGEETVCSGSSFRGNSSGRRTVCL